MARGPVFPHPVEWFLPGEPVVAARAPGRLDVMGGIADYSGALVLELPLALDATVAVQRSDDTLITVCTAGPAVPHLGRNECAVPLDALRDGPPDSAPERLRAALIEAGAPWAAYPLGPLAILYAERLIALDRGLRMAVWSEVPAGAGISSSAALEVASLRALLALHDRDLAPLHMAAMAQQAEHRVALAPCGIMDQATAVLGRRDHLLMLRCQPADLLGHKRLPGDVRIGGIDSGVAHRVAGTQYGRVRVAAFMGRAIIRAADAGDPPGGYLCNLAPDRYYARYAALLPEEIRGTAFLARHGETGDTATRVDPEAVYRVRDCTTHPIEEQANVDTFLAALDHYEATGDAAALVAAGEAMYRSHDSYGRRCGLGTPETDLLVDLVRDRGPASGLYGAKITGGGQGGTVVVLGAGPAAGEAVAAIAEEYRRRTGNPARVLTGSDDGALHTPPTRWVVDPEGRIHEH